MSCYAGIGLIYLVFIKFLGGISRPCELYDLYVNVLYTLCRMMTFPNDTFLRLSWSLSGT